MTLDGTAAYAGRTDLPPLVAAAVELARRCGFAYSCRPEQGELLRLLARGVGAGRIGETGTGYGVGLAWLRSGAHPDASLWSVERDPDRAAEVRSLMLGIPGVQVVTGDWRDLPGAPFDLLVLDGGGQGKGTEGPLDPAHWLRPGGTLVIDDFTPMTGWPPTYEGRADTVRMHWLGHPDLATAEIRLTPTAAALVATYICETA
jgi:predicted O-methyltransferase YrrM